MRTWKQRLQAAVYLRPAREYNPYKEHMTTRPARYVHEYDPYNTATTMIRRVA